MLSCSMVQKTNYGLWFRDDDVIGVQGTMGCCLGGEAVTEKKMQQAHAAIVLNLADSQLMHVIGSEAATDA